MTMTPKEKQLWIELEHAIKRDKWLAFGFGFCIAIFLIWFFV